MAKADLTTHTLRKLLNYDPATGVFTRIKKGSRSPAGTIVGNSRDGGRKLIRVAGFVYKAHRLAWLYCYGAWPVGCIDHIDGNPSNNRIDNLRDVTVTINAQNIKRARSHNLSGILGVGRTRNGKWYTRIVVNGKKIYLGVFETQELAHDAYVNAKRVHHVGNTI